MIPDFNQVIDRKNTNSSKWDFNKEIFGVEDVLPMWVADMDFPVPPEVTKALVERAQHPIYGYSRPDQAYFNAIRNWVKRTQDWEIENEWIMYTPGIVSAINLLIQIFSHPGDKILIQQPVYHPFANSITNNGRQVINSPLTNESGRYYMDFEDLERKMQDSRMKIMLLCNPHNPVGRVWTEEELSRLGRICLDNNVLVVSDEIHSDLIFNGYRHIPYATISKEFEQCCIVCNSPSKTFNLAGLQVSNVIIPNRILRNEFQSALTNNSIEVPNVFSIEALKTAYDYGEEWLQRVMVYVQDNYLFLSDYFGTYLPQIKITKPEGTFLVWLDFRSLGMGARDLSEFLLKKAKVALNEGAMFGPEGEGFARINIACPRAILEEGLKRIRLAIEEIG